ncbi:MAG: preprotein translocase subunit SecG [Gammaproteobacteria bacterium]|nr:preprotein translocase subunit SecG [Gammaproteobacteria bacterium]
MESLIIFVHVIAAIAITGLVLIQQGKGADMGASFGSGASQTLFGSSGSGNALTKSTSIMAVVFFITSLGLAIIARQQASLSVDDSGLIENLDEIAAAPATQTAAEDLPLAIEDALDDIPELATEPE